jgi:hypothetical protein
MNDSPAAIQSLIDGLGDAFETPPIGHTTLRGPAAPDGWPEPEPLGGELPAVPAFNVGLLPESFRPLVEDTAERMQVPQEFPAVAAVLSLAGVTGRRSRIQPREHDTSWIEVPNLWGGIVAPPGMMKSPVITAITRPLARIEEGWRADFEVETRAYEQQQEEAELDRQAWREQYKVARKQDKAAPVRPDTPIATTAPTCRRLITQNATAEKLHELMQENPAGIFVIADELTGWLATLDKPGREGERGFYLSAWNGDTGYALDRIGRGSIYVPACCASILGGIQPARLRTYLSDALQDGPMNDGLFQRFQLLVYPDQPKQWQLIDRAPNHAAIAQAAETYRQLVNMEVGSIPVFRFAAEAQELFNAWLTELETTKLRGNDLHPALVAHLAKYRSLMPSLALLFHLADRETGAVSLTHARKAAAWCEYLEAHARRVYASRISPERMAAISLGRRLKEGWKRDKGRFSVRDVYQNDWAALVTPEEVRAAVRVLEDAGWVRAEETKRDTGRPSEVYAINPRIGGVHVGD